MPNPFTPKRSKPAPKPPGSTPPPAVGPGTGVVEPSRAELDDMRKAELVALARERGLDTEGTRAELIDRLAP
ncbi:MAG: SAP domain-containing protein [Pseudonocardia sp.]|nr:SAP domain-containing protein [Pseudonocardia sp.]